MAVNGSGLRPLGHVVGETTHYMVVFTARRPPRVGEYVLVEYPRSEYGDLVLAIVERSRIGNPALEASAITPEYVERAHMMAVERHEYMMGTARLLGWVEPLCCRDRRELITPKYPPRPGAAVYEAGDDVLRRIFAREERGWVRVGRLINHPNVPVYVDASSIVSRHLAILAVTGGGKSNTVGILVDRIVNDLNGTVFLVDMHNEYENVARGKTNLVEPRIHPASLTTVEYYNLLSLDRQATKQRLYLRKAVRDVRSSGEAMRKPDRFLELLIKKLWEYAESENYKKDRNSIVDLINKLEELEERYGGTLLNPGAPMRLDAYVRPGMANVLRLGHVDEDVADAVVYHYLSWLLKERKDFVHTRGESGYPVPVLAVIEEAHILMPRDRPTLTKYVGARIAREGRKFGLGLCLVSQRPKNVDEDALSQTNNKIILRLVEPNDRRYVQRASETLSEELVEMLPGLNTGEAIVLGMMAPLPALVKIDEVKWKLKGSDIDAPSAWAEWARKQREGGGDEIDAFDVLD